MATMAALVGIAAMAVALIALAAGDRIVAVDSLVVAGLAFAVWGVTRRRRTSAS